jgi:hypothetical protein
MKTLVRGQAVRLVVALMILASSAIVVEAGQRWHG